MKVFAVGDLHFSTAVDKPMDIFGENWKNHDQAILNDWKQRVGEEDLVLLLGDTSWAISLEDAKKDFDRISSMPGKKVVIKGNHDYWWSTVSKMNKMYEDIEFLGTNFYSLGDVAICGTRGWVCPNETEFSKEDQRIFDRELGRMKLSIEAAKKAGFKKILAILHYPPTNNEKEDSAFTRLFEQEGVFMVLYGHLHGEESFNAGPRGQRNGVYYDLVSLDYVNFKLKELSLNQMG